MRERLLKGIQPRRVDPAFGRPGFPGPLQVPGMQRQIDPNDPNILVLPPQQSFVFLRETFQQMGTERLYKIREILEESISSRTDAKR